MKFSIDSQNFFSEVIQSNQPVIVNFWAPWCGLCRMLTPSLVKLQSEYHGLVKLVSINADENFKLANTYRLTSLPTLLLFYQGQLVERVENFQEREIFYQKVHFLVDTLVKKTA